MRKKMALWQKNSICELKNASNSLEAITKSDRKTKTHIFKAKKVVKISSNISKMATHRI